MVYRVEKSDEVNTLIHEVYQVEQPNEVNTLIDEVIEDYSFWHSHQDKEYSIDSIHASTKEEHHKDSIGVLDGT